MNIKFHCGLTQGDLLTRKCVCPLGWSCLCVVFLPPSLSEQDYKKGQLQPHIPLDLNQEVLPTARVH